LFGRDTDKNKKNKADKTLITSATIEANNVSGILANNGWLFWGGGPSGFITPSPVFSSNDGNFATVFASGLWVVGTINNEKRAAIANYVTDFVPGLYDEFITDEDTYGPVNSDYKIYYHYSNAHIEYLEQLLINPDQTAEQKIHNFAESELEKAAASNPEWDTKAVAQGALADPPGDVSIYCLS
jgi:hypothetical protein